jgi:hypothetical protein
MFRFLFPVLFLLANAPLLAQPGDASVRTLVREELLRKGVATSDIQGLRLADAYVDEGTGVRHTWYRQQWMGLDIFNTEVALHQRPDGGIIAMNHSLARGLAKLATDPQPAFGASEAMTRVLLKDGLSFPAPRIRSVDESARTTRFDGAPFHGDEAFATLMWMRWNDEVRLVWNVNYHHPDGQHWWNVRIDARDGTELERNDWTSQCAFDGLGDAVLVHPHEHGEPPMPAAPNDYNVYPAPEESPNHGPRAIRNAPWTNAPVASPYGWHDTNGAAGAEFTITRGNNVWAMEDVDGNNGTGASPSGGANLDFDFPINLTQEPINYQAAAVTNLFFWNNIMHDVWYRYGFTEASGNFQSNNYGRGGAGNDFVVADAQDGSGTNNANFSTPADGSSGRMQMFLWTSPTPDRDGDLDNGIIAHEYTHGISTRLVGGPSNVNCLFNAEQMGEGWSDWFGLMMTIEPGDARTDVRGIGTYALAQPTTGTGIRPAPYTTNFAVNNYTYANTNSGVSEPHGIGFVWCTMLWEMTWDLIDQYGFDPDLYNGNGGNNIAMQLVVDALKLTPCNPGFVDGRNAILQADQVRYNGANQNLIWAAFARRGLGFSATQGSTSSRADQVEAFNLPVNNSVGISAVINPASPSVGECSLGPAVSVVLRNSGLLAQSNFPVRYSLDGAPNVVETFTGTLPAQGTATFTFTTLLPAISIGAHTMQVATQLAGDQFTTDDVVTYNFTNNAASAVPYTENLESAAQVPTGWTLQNPDNGATWTNVAVTNGALCTSSRAWTINYYAYDAAGQQDRLISPVVDLAGSAGTRLRFHHAYAQYSSTYVDSLRVQVSADCGTSWTTVFQQGAAALATATTTTNSFVPGACAQWRLNDIDLGAFDGRRVQVRFVGVCGYGNNLYLDNIELTRNGVRIALRMMLDGPFDATTGVMNDGLRASGLVPALEPYSALGYTQAAGGGGQLVQSGVLARTGNDAIVDWVQVELRDAATPATVVATCPALLQRDGDVVAENGTAPIAFRAANGSYHVAVRHRNHLGCMTAGPIALSNTATSIDLRDPATATFGTGARRVNGSVATLWPGEVLRDGSVKYVGQDNDRDPVLTAVGGTTPNSTAPGYLPGDVNLDGVVKYVGENNDRDPILLNVGGTAPNNVRTQQLP